MKMSFEKMRAVCEQHGKPYFSKENLSFWHSRLVDEADDYQLFVEGINDFYDTKRLYMVNCIGFDGSIVTLEPSSVEEKSLHFPTKEAALKFRTAAESLIPDTHKDVAHCEPAYESGVFLLTNKSGDTFILDTNTISDAIYAVA